MMSTTIERPHTSDPAPTTAITGLPGDVVICFSVEDVIFFSVEAVICFQVLIPRWLRL
jgi:hypothetical protein